MKKIIAAALAVLMLAALCACGSRIPEGFDEAQVIAQAETVVDIINTKDYDAVTAMLRDDLEPEVPAESLKQAWDDTLTQSGGFVEFKKASVSGNTDSTTGEAYAVAVVVCKYENGTRTFTLSFNKGLELVGLYMK